jgi:hypothetical protein
VAEPWNTEGSASERGYAAKARNDRYEANYDDLPDRQKNEPKKVPYSGSAQGRADAGRAGIPQMPLAWSREGTRIGYRPSTGGTWGASHCMRDGCGTVSGTRVVADPPKQLPASPGPRDREGKKCPESKSSCSSRMAPPAG